ncbi:hypothetical protein B0H19DRAFT_1269142 [Mycena capillaripes]|nr:hypothetical protein B0H19DRAFT_1269142 [Mycena capillaripes]
MLAVLIGFILHLCLHHCLLDRRCRAHRHHGGWRRTALVYLADHTQSKPLFSLIVFIAAVALPFLPLSDVASPSARRLALPHGTALLVWIGIVPTLRRVMVILWPAKFEQA